MQFGGQFMSTSECPPLNEEEWTLVQDFNKDKHGVCRSKFEAKAVTDVSKQYIDDEIVIVKKTAPMGGERTYILPQRVIKETARRLR